MRFGLKPHPLAADIVSRQDVRPHIIGEKHGQEEEGFRDANSNRDNGGTCACSSFHFLYTHPLWVALGAHFLLSGDRLTVAKGGGLVLAFAGLIAIFGSRSATLGPLYWMGDLMEVAAAIFWAATTLYIKKVVEGREITHYQTLFGQLFYSIPLLTAAWFLFERGQLLSLTGPVVVAFAYQCLVVAFFSYLLWFWMIHRFPVSRLAAFTFMAPVFGVILSGLILKEPIPLLLWVGLLLVAAGIYLVNRPEKVSQAH